MAEMPTTVSKDSTVVLDNYAVDGASPTNAHVARLRTLRARIARTIRAKNAISATVTVEGHTDATGTHLYNKRLGARRAEHTVLQLKSLLANEGLEDRVQYVIRSAGEADPVASNSTEKGRAANRRVSVTLAWVVPVPPRRRKRPMPKPTATEPELTRKSVTVSRRKRPMPKPTEPGPEVTLKWNRMTSACVDAASLRRHLGGKRELLENTLFSTSLYWQRGAPIGLKINNRSILGKFTKSVRDKVIAKVKSPVQERIFGKQGAAALGAALSYVALLGGLEDDFESERIMGGFGEEANEARLYKHRKLVCALVANEQLLTGSKWMTLYKDWMELGRLEELCAESRGILPSKRGAEKVLPPAGHLPKRRNW